MKLLSIEEFKTLARQRNEFCVSMFMPAHRTEPGTQQDSIRLKNLLRDAESHLIHAGMRGTNAKKLLQPAVELDTCDFWQHQCDGLAIFVSQDWWSYYCLPVSFEEQVIIGNHFHLKPLLPLFTGDDRFYILALSQQQIRLLRGTRDRVDEIDLADIIPRLKEFLRFEEPERQLSSHTGTPGTTMSRHGVSSGATVFHGHGAGDEHEKENLRLYFRRVDEALQTFLRQERAPLILAGVEYLLPIYRSANTYPNAIESAILGNPEMLKAEELHKQALAILEAQFLQAQEEAIAHYHELAGTEKVSNNIHAIIPAASGGRIDRLFVKTHLQQWGTFDPETQKVDLHSRAEAGDEELLDFAAIQTILNDGTVYAIDDRPEEVPLAAVFRY
jgi:Bacterial archaeo-eukaryotic release factor family 3